jgi:protoporphyrinogen oxidase
MMERIAILGGGIAGVVAAYNLARQGKQVTLIERTAKLGGLMRSIEAGGHTYDIGAFIFDKNNAFINTFPGLRQLFHEADHLNQVITVNGTLDWYPFSLKGYVGDRGYGALALAAASILVAKIRDRKKEDLLQYIRYYIGSKLYEESGLRAYIERLYKTTDDTVGVEFGHQRMQSIQHDAALRKNFAMIFSRLVGSRIPESAPWRCLVRPREGFDAVFGHVESVLQATNVDVQFSRSIKLIERDASGTFHLSCTDGVEFESDRIISTIPIDELARYLGRTQFEYDPEYMTLISLFYTFKGDLGLAGTYLYNFTKEGSW